MDDIIIKRFLESRNAEYEDLYERFKNFMIQENLRKDNKIRMTHHQNWNPVIYNEFEESDSSKKIKRQQDLHNDVIEDKSMDGSHKEHFEETQARMIVAKMQHEESGRRYIGEKFEIEKVREIMERYKGLLPPVVTVYDVYVAMNAQYHDYCELFKAWFGESIDQKIVESAITFWFRDTSYKCGNKVWNYLTAD